MSLKPAIFRRKQQPDLFERLEQEAADELRLLDELGPQSFGTEHLMELHAQVCARQGEQQRLLKMAVAVGCAGAGWLVLGILAQTLRYPIPGLVAFGLAAICLLSFFGALIYALRRFRTKGYLDHTRLCIEDELRARRDKQRTRMGDW